MERLSMNKQISRQNHEWQRTFDAIADSIALIDAEQRIVRCNQATRKILGREFADIINQPCWKLFHDAEGPVAGCPMEKAIRTHNSETATIQHHDRWLEITVDPLLSDEGELTGAVHIVRDITEHYRLVNSITDANELFSLFMKFSPIYCFIKEISDSESRVIQASDNFIDMVGIPAEEMIGKTMHQLFPQEFADMITADDQRVYETREVLRLEENFDDKSYITYKFPIERADGRALLAGYTINISDRKLVEESLRTMQRQIVQQEKMASIGQLAAGVAHEINNPMGFITSNLTSLVKYADRLDEYIAALLQSLYSCPAHQGISDLDSMRQKLKVDYIISDVRELVNESLDGAHRVQRIVQDLKSFSRIDQVESCRINLNEALETTINIAWNELKYISTLERDFGDIPDIVCYPQQLNQVFLNLLVNAAQAMEKQGNIKVCTWTDIDNVFVSVTDNGKGMAEEVKRRIFEPFFTTKEAFKGTGLGLSISADIVRKHGGEITVASEVGVGTTFTVRLPVKGLG
jgi:PAS domain S-box-containing protein